MKYWGNLAERRESPREGRDGGVGLIGGELRNPSQGFEIVPSETQNLDQN